LTGKNIKTLVGDIYGLFSNKKTEAFSEASIRDFSERLGRKISTRVSDERSPPALRLSNIGTPCRRQLYYRINSPESSEPLPPEARIKFLFGDILEELLLWLATEAGHTVKGEQDEVTFHGVKGHRDAIIDGHLVDAKSASSYSFNKFASHLTPDGDAFGYIPQLQTYLRSSEEDPDLRDKDAASFLVIDKTLGKITLDTHEKDSVDYERKVDELREILARDKPPPRDFSPEPFGKSGNEKLPVVCSYCAFKKLCHPHVRTFVYSTGPVYLTKVTREPDVYEEK
jgi:hypothetical protein